jgi:hypothetical protein
MTSIKAALFASVALIAPAHAVTFQIVDDPKTGGYWIDINGKVMYGDDIKLADFVNTAPKPIIGVFLNSPGGNVVAGQNIGAFIRNNQLTTAVMDHDICLSICFEMWAAGVHRIVSEGAGLAVHSVSDGDGQETIGTESSTIESVRRLKAYGVSDAILGKMASTKPGDISMLTSADAVGMDVKVIPLTDEQKIDGEQRRKNAIAKAYEPQEANAQPTEIHAPQQPLVTTYQPGPSVTYAPTQPTYQAPPPPPVYTSGPHRYWTATCKAFNISVDTMGGTFGITGPNGRTTVYQSTKQDAINGFIITASRSDQNRTITTHWTNRGVRFITKENGFLMFEGKSSNEHCDNVQGSD